jgi:PAS domain S-box-containing protein
MHSTAGDFTVPSTDLRILVIEDEQTDYDLVLRELTNAGLSFKAERVDAVDQLETSLKQFNPHLILSDFSLQGFDGLHALDVVRAVDPDLPFILVTGTLTDVMAFEAVKKGATDYVLKDRLERLTITVARAMNELTEKRKLRAAQHAAFAVLRQRQEALANYAQTQTLRIIILEDDPTDVALVDAELRKSGLRYELLSCEDETEFRRSVGQQKPHVFIADFAVPTFDGVAALELRELLCPDVPFIFLSGIMGEELAIEAVKAGATDYVMKHNLFALPTAIKRAVNEVQERVMRIEAEQGLEVNQINRLITDNMAAALFLLDEHGFCVFANPRAVQLTNYSMAELKDQRLLEKLHTGLAEGSVLPPHECLFSVEPDSLGAARPLRAREEVCVRKDGTLANVLYTATDIVTNGAVTGTVVEMLDITNEKMMEQFSLNVKALNDELQTLAQVVSHELQEHVGKIRSYLNLLAVRYNGRLGPDADEFMLICTDSASIIAQMVEDLWTYARINKLDVEQQYVNSATILAATVEELRTRMETVQAKVTYGKLPVVYSNAKQLNYLFRSLIDNALKFHGTDTPAINISAREKGSMWIFAVEDNGIGIDSMHARDVFKIFHRLNAKPGVGGTGMGLAICRKIVERNAGDIWFEPNPSGGSTFCFSLPSHVFTRPSLRLEQ